MADDVGALIDTEELKPSSIGCKIHPECVVAIQIGGGILKGRYCMECINYVLWKNLVNLEDLE